MASWNKDFRNIPALLNVINFIQPKGPETDPINYNLWLLALVNVSTYSLNLGFRKKVVTIILLCGQQKNVDSSVRPFCQKI